MEPVSRGRVILLNGPSSSGKSSIGQALLAVLPDPWFHVPVDGISGMRSTRYTRELDDAGVQEMLRRTRRGYHRAVAALTSTGNDVVMDYLLSEPWRLDDLLVVLDSYDVTLVDVHCAPEELARRERSRGDRPHGLAASQTLIYSHRDNDLVVDTTHRTAADCAREIAGRLDAIGRPKAFERLRAARARTS
ncbi:chloramphenicol phosphotransferase CPT family protein [Amycolatopsis sp. DSM 110486]|uniref:chloramphenicol phosphotransferase CPT family protein n=1 Tax=Amycolatopsis sp. DSM 110486 TaxID=2865832 RepID=UPI001C6A173D|nr:AAA family ATPase [Amycolatopsis sp. DSM 110486]QYN21826.1 chloramphenicol phosphotransferase CPT family protein [Amycolatopsis sp. DSM 110486]